jgi:hypothetical protein
MSETQQQFIQGILNEVVPSLNNPSNQFYLPKYIQGSNLDPYNPPAGSTWKIQNLNSTSILNEIPTICTDIQMNATTSPCSNANDSYNAVPNRGADITLSNVVVTGASNAVLSSATATSSDGFTIQVVISFSTLSNYPTPVTIKGDFQLTVYCCCGSGLTGCDDPNTTGDAQTGSGTFTATIKSSSATCTVQITDLQEGVLNLEVTGINYQASTQNISITPVITSIPGQEGQSYSNLAKEAFDDPGTLNYVLQQVNAQLNTSSALSQMGNVLQTELDTYLKTNNEYPFGSASAAAM